MPGRFNNDSLVRQPFIFLVLPFASTLGGVHPIAVKRSFMSVRAAGVYLNAELVSGIVG